MTVKEWLGEDNQLGIDIWERKYRYENETFDEWLDRVSGGNQNLRQLIVEKKFLFGGRILANRGLDKKGVKCTLSNCYVLTPPEDNIPSIYEAARKLADTFKMGGGCGLDIGKLAPRGAKVNNTAKVTSGAVSFMDLFNLTTELIGQNGRRGALMLSIPCDHPDLEEFINIKTDLNKINKANISIRITDDFMKAVEENRMWKLSFTREETGEVIEKEVEAKRIFRMICENNWDYAEPGVLFWDRINNWNLLSEDPNFEYAGTNPCAEEPLPAGGSCLLGAINLAEFVENGKFDHSAFRWAVCEAVDALNDVLDEGLPLHPLQEQRDSVRDWRQIGLGIMGLGDMLIKCGLRYGSPESIALCDIIGREMAEQAICNSTCLLTDTVPYPKYNYNAVSRSAFFYYNTDDETKGFVKTHGLRNSQLLTIAPTGTLSTMLGISGGIEPIFAKSYTRKTESLHGHDEYYKVYPKIVKEYMDIHGLKDESELPDFFVTAQELDYHERIDMQAVWQDHIDASISSTVNVPNDFTVEQVEDMYLYAWKKKLKGLTMFRDRCKRAGILTTEKPKNASEEPTEAVESESDKCTPPPMTLDDYWPVPLKRGEVIKVNDTCVGKKRTLHTGCGTLHCEAFFDPITGDLLETYLSKGSTGGCNNFMVGLSRMISLAARGGISVEAIVDQLRSSGTCPSYAVRSATKHDTSKGSSCPVAVGNALMDMYNEMRADIAIGNNEKTILDIIEDSITTNPKCPVCGGYLVFEGGCNNCKDCGWSTCG